MRGRPALVLTLVLLLPRPVHAESAAIACAYYGGPEVTPPAGPIPANQPLFHIGIQGAAVQWSQITLTRERDGHVVPLVFWEVQTWGQQPSFSATETLEVGATYVLQHPDCIPEPGRTTTYTVVDPIAGPTSLGTLSLRGPFVSTFGEHGVCHERVFYALDLAADPAFDAEPWSSFEWTYGYDGSDAPGPWYSVSATRVSMLLDCTVTGPHRLRGSAVPIATASTAAAPFRTPDLDVTLSCADPTWVDPITLGPLVPSAIAFWEDDPMGTCSMDGGVPSSIDAAVDGSAHTEPGTQPNCGCGVARTGAPGWLGWLGVAAWLTRRRARLRAG